MQCDVLVAGGGSAGIAAAVSAARAGAKTLLVEHQGFLGGMATASLVHSICGLYKISTTPEPVWANTGFPVEFAQRLMHIQGTTGPVRMGRLDVLLVRPPAFAFAADQITATTPNLEVRLHTTVVRAECDLTQLEIFCRGRGEIVEPKVIIDTTGDAVVATLAGATTEQEPSGRLQRPAYIFGIQGLAVAALTDEHRLKLSRHIANAVYQKRLPTTALGATFRETHPSGEAYVSIDLPGLENYDPSDPGCLSGLETQGRETAFALTAFLRSEVESFAGSFISVLPGRVGIRESRRIIGKYQLTADDILTGATFSDAVALATWPMEVRETTAGPKLRYPFENRGCDIPLRVLQARDRDNLFMAGRCISATHEAQASIRVMGTCLATGEAAGAAAARLIR